MRSFHFRFRGLRYEIYFTDDIVILANNDRHLFHNIRILQEELEKLNMEITLKKQNTSTESESYNIKE